MWIWQLTVDTAGHVPSKKGHTILARSLQATTGADILSGPAAGPARLMMTSPNPIIVLMVRNIRACVLKGGASYSGTVQDPVVLGS